MDSRNQFYVFCLCLIIGVVGGIVYDVLACVRVIFGKRRKDKIVVFSTDLLFSVCFAIVCIGASFLFHFPDFRVYMCIGYAVGGIIYLKTLHILVAFLKKVCYNICTKMVEKAKKARKNSQKEVDIII
ncbi:MAG: spore cortex biosynthesis protein YabQ [Clostridia bacterium]|nr:spore cortex biosynthesis protein YabQ [Clostridia bacterium]